MNINKKLENGNENYIKKVNEDSSLRKIIESLASNGQHPYSLIITCSDSRVSPEIIFDTYLGELFVIRTAGNVINAGELATIEYAIEHLHIKHIVVLGHTSCGAIHACIHNEQGQYLDPILSKIKEGINDEKDEYQASVKNVLHQIQYIKEKFPHYDGELVPMIYDLHSNKVSRL